MSYIVIDFDINAAVKRLSIILVVAAVLTYLNTLTSAGTWVKSGENFVLFFPVIVGTLLYGFATGAVFSAGQSAWGRAVATVKDGNEKIIKELIEEKPDQFPTFLMFIGWFILTLSSLYVQIPYQMLFLLFFLHLTLLTPLILAMDYWGFSDGIKKIVKR